MSYSLSSSKGGYIGDENRGLGDTRSLDYGSCTWTAKVCKIMAFMAILIGLGLLFYIFLGFR